MSLHVVIVNDASTARGGATGLALLSARLLRGRGIAVTLFTGDSGENAELAALGVRIVALGGTRLNAARHRSVTSALYNRAAAAALAEFIAAHDGAEVVYHLHGWGQIFSPAIFTALQPVAARTVIHAHDFFLACPNGAFTDFPRSALCERRPLSLSCLTANCDKRSYAHKIWRVARHGLLERSFPQSLPWAAVAMIHPGMAPHLRRGGLPASRLVTLRNPAEPYRAARVPAEENDRFFFIGRIEPDKGARELAQAARAAGVPLTMIGDGSLRAPLAEAYPEVTFPGWKSREEIGEMIGSARALVLATRYPEPFGLVVAEALSTGIPVILPEASLLAPEVTARGLGLLCDMQRPETLQAAIVQMRDLPAEAIRAMSLRAADPAEALATTPEGWADGLIALYEGCLSGAMPSRAIPA